MIPRAALLTEDSPDGELARALAAAIGSALQAADGTAAAADLLALAGALADARQARRDLADECFVDSAYDLLAEWERAYGLPVEPDLGVAARRDRLVAKVRAARAGSPQGILRAVRALDPSAGLTENTPADVPRIGDSTIPPVAGADRDVYLFAVQLSVAAWSDATLRARIAALVEQMKPAHAAFTLHTNSPATGFLADDPNSLTDRDVLGS